MKSTTLFTSLIAAGLLATTPTFAGPWDGIDMQGSILNDLDKPAYVGTGLGTAKPRPDIYNGAFAGSVDIDKTGFAVGNAGPEKGQGDLYGWSVLDLGR